MLMCVQAHMLRSRGSNLTGVLRGGERPLSESDILSKLNIVHLEIPRAGQGSIIQSTIFCGVFKQFSGAIVIVCICCLNY